MGRLPESTSGKQLHEIPTQMHVLYHTTLIQDLEPKLSQGNEY